MDHPSILFRRISKKSVNNEKEFLKGGETAKSESGPKDVLRQEKSGRMILFTGLLFIEKSFGELLFIFTVRHL